jgi:hypothetical protein
VQPAAAGPDGLTMAFWDFDKRDEYLLNSYLEYESVAGKSRHDIEAFSIHYAV